MQDIKQMAPQAVLRAPSVGLQPALFRLRFEGFVTAGESEKGKIKDNFEFAQVTVLYLRRSAFDSRM